MGLTMPEIASGYEIPEAVKGTILERILYAKLHELIGASRRLPAASLESVLDRAPETRSLKNALTRKTPAVIAEIKRCSPSAGLIRKDFDPMKIAGEYTDSGAAAISVVTEVQHFHGGLEILARLRWNIKLPLLRKDFIVDSYQILEARHAGADAVLLIAALLNAATLKKMLIQAERYGMEALIEVHNETELHRALEAGASLIGVNNRDLRSFKVSLDVALNLARMLPENVVAVAESGIKTADDMRRLSDAGYRGFLVGESLMRSPFPGAALSQLLNPEKKFR
jgi:indole-3-glycerol phosphate synthase